jgi:hypothetical protein
MKRSLICPHFFTASFGLVLAFAFAAASFAQTSDADRAQLTTSQVPYGTSPVTGGHAVSSPNDSDLGEQEILKREERYEPFTATAGVPFYWTSNVALSRNDEREDFIMAPSAGLFFQPRLTRTIFGLVDIREQMFLYDRFDDFDFNAFDVDVGLSCVVPQLDNLLLRLQYNYERLSTDQGWDEFFSDHSIIFNAEAPVALGRNQQLAFGTYVKISLASEPERPRRDDYEGYVSYNVNLTRAFNVNAVARIVVRDYLHQQSRVDMSEIGSLIASYRFTKYLTASALGTWAANQSNKHFFDYEVANAGGALSLAIKF